LRFTDEAAAFLDLEADRLGALAALLAARKIPHAILRTEGEPGPRHLLVRLGAGAPRLAVAAHYDRFPGSLGVLDNSCACLQLVDFAARMSALGPGAPPILVAFTDAEESPGSGEGAESQGAYSLARALRGLGPAVPGVAGATAARRAGRGLPVLVLDVTGRGDRLILSSAPGDLLARHGLSASRAASGHRGLVELARRAASRALLGRPPRLPLPWSDDLGFVLGGLPALVVSLLPAVELAGLGAGLRPRTWELLHGPGDLPGLAEEGAFALMARFLDAVAAELSSK